MSLNGIDISAWQSGINLSGTGVPADFVVIKATQGTQYVNPDCVRAYDQAKAAGRLLGVYHYIQGSGAQAEAKFFVDSVRNWIGEAVLAVDWESEQNSAWGNEQYLDAVVAAVIEYSGVRPLIYGMASNYSMLSSVASKYNCGLWVAQYANMSPTGYQQTPWNQGSYACCMRQYASTGRLAGYSGNLDLDKFYGDAATWHKYAAHKRVSSPTVSQPSVMRPQEVTEKPIQSSALTYTVQPGDTLSGIATRFGTTYQHLAAINNIKDPDRIYPGEVLMIRSNATHGAVSNTYKIQPGDTLSGIASRFGTTYQHLAAINNIKDPNKIYAGQTIRV